MTTLLKENNINFKEVVRRLNDGQVDDRIATNLDLVIGYDTLAREMQNFIYEGRPGRSKRIRHTPEEYEKFIQKSIKKMWKFHNAGLEAIKKNEEFSEYEL